MAFLLEYRCSGHMHRVATQTTMKMPSDLPRPSKSFISRTLSLISGPRYACAALVCAVLLLYIKTLAFNLTCLDDDWLVSSGLHSLRGSAPWTDAVIHSWFAPYYRPMLQLSFMLDALAGASTLVCHATNIALHALAACLAFRMFLTLFGKRHTAFFCGLIFAVHPLMVPAVAWIPGRNDLLLGVFIFPAFTAFVNYLASGSRRQLLLHMILFAFALFTKETAVMLLPVCFAYALLLQRENLARAARLLYFWLPLFAVWAFFWFQSLAASTVMHQQPASATAHFTALAVYIGKMLAPFNLSVFPVAQHLHPLAGVAAISLVALLWIAARYHRRTIALGAAWILAFFLPTFVSNQGIYYEHRSYVPLAGLLIVLAAAVEEAHLRFPSVRRLTAAFAVLSAALLFAISFVNADYYMGKLTFWKRAVACSPDSGITHCNLGLVYLQKGRYDLALHHLTTAERLTPADAATNCNLATAYFQMGDYGAARLYAEKTISLAPDSAQAYNILGCCYARESRHDDAIQCFEETLNLDRNDKSAEKNLSAVLALKRHGSKSLSRGSL